MLSSPYLASTPRSLSPPLKDSTAFLAFKTCAYGDSSDPTPNTFQPKRTQSSPQEVQGTTLNNIARCTVTVPYSDQGWLQRMNHVRKVVLMALTTHSEEAPRVTIQDASCPPSSLRQGTKLSGRCRGLSGCSGESLH